ncbi:hypothetical protein VNI00_018395 [Paramarasmius palmivorus]|uniref:Uncharacterized protein n=1 Tax=Paramarasmius palmivorus TaxID=297713 RepID=A0AAW0AXN4_9AGAR
MSLSASYHYARISHDHLSAVGDHRGQSLPTAGPPGVAALSAKLIAEVEAMDPTTDIRQSATLNVQDFPDTPWPKLCQMVVDCAVVIPDFSTKPFDYQYISQPIDITFIQGGGFDCDVHYQKFLREIHLPINVRHAVVTDGLPVLEYIRHARNRWHTKALLVIDKSLPVDTYFLHSMQEHRPLAANVEQLDTKLPSFWSMVEEAVGNRDSRAAIFHQNSVNWLIGDT